MRPLVTEVLQHRVIRIPEVCTGCDVLWDTINKRQQLLELTASTKQCLGAIPHAAVIALDCLP